MQPNNQNLYRNGNEIQSYDGTRFTGLKRHRNENFEHESHVLDNPKGLKRAKRGSFGDLPRCRSLPLMHTYDPADVTKAKRIFSQGSEVNLVNLTKLNSNKVKDKSNVSVEDKYLPYKNSVTESATTSKFSDLGFRNSVKQDAFVPSKLFDKPNKRSFLLFSDSQ